MFAFYKLSEEGTRFILLRLPNTLVCPFHPFHRHQTRKEEDTFYVMDALKLKSACCFYPNGQEYLAITHMEERGRRELQE